MHAALELLMVVRRQAINLHKLAHGQPLQPERKSTTLRAVLDKVKLVAIYGSTCMRSSTPHAATSVNAMCA